MNKHITVLKKESVEFTIHKNGGIYIDATTGGGGHSLEFLSILQKGTLICFDIDPDALQAFKQVLIDTGYEVLEKNILRKDRKKVELVNDNFINIEIVRNS